MGNPFDDIETDDYDAIPDDNDDDVSDEDEKPEGVDD